MKSAALLRLGVRFVYTVRYFPMLLYRSRFTMTRRVICSAAMVHLIVVEALRRVLLGVQGGIRPVTPWRTKNLFALVLKTDAIRMCEL